MKYKLPLCKVKGERVYYYYYKVKRVLPAHRVKGGTTVSGGSTELSAIAEQSFIKLLLPITTFLPDKTRKLSSFNKLKTVIKQRTF